MLARFGDAATGRRWHLRRGRRVAPDHGGLDVSWKGGRVAAAAELEAEAGMRTSRAGESSPRADASWDGMYE